MILKEYQERTLARLEEYFKLVARKGVTAAYSEITQQVYRPVPGMAAVPYVCIRIPTGGGKTLTACHALGVVSTRFVNSSQPLCLWLVPSNTIREQTIRALKDRNHPYRQALDRVLTGGVKVLDLSEAMDLSRAALDTHPTIVVASIQALRVEDPEGRKIYSSSGTLMSHFDALDRRLASELERDENGFAPFSLANVFRLRRPVVIMDEAHNARTSLSFSALERFRPSCVLEFTATPAHEHDPARGSYASNVLCHVSATELKAAEMIKLPVRLRTYTDWRETLSAAVQCRKMLEDVANLEEQTSKEYLRPIVLIQAQTKSKERDTLTTDAVKAAMQNDLRIPTEEIAVVTGDTRQLEGVNLWDRDCPVKYIITVKALAEGWDCSLAYVFATVAESHSAQAVEQILGRILRMPGAKRKGRQELNSAYAFAASQSFADTAMTLKDALVDHGFERYEAEEAIIDSQQMLDGFTSHSTILEIPIVDGTIIMDSLPTALQSRVTFDSNSHLLRLSGSISATEATAIAHSFRNKSIQEAILNALTSSHTAQFMEIGTELRIPALSLDVNGQIDIIDESHIFSGALDLSSFPIVLTEQEFGLGEDTASEGTVDINETGNLEIRFVDHLHTQLQLLSIEERGWTLQDLASWIDRQIPHTDITQQESLKFIERAIRHLIDNRGITLEQVAVRKFRLARALEGLIDRNRIAFQESIYKESLFGSNRLTVVVGDVSV